jgi:protein-tyrosine phosphatase
MEHRTRILFVCAGNICRSAMAEAFFRHLAADRPGLHHVEVASAGTIAYDGNRPLAPCVTVMRDDFGIDMTAHRARRIRPSLAAELILTVDSHVAQQVREAGVTGDIQPLGDFVGSPGEHVEDPYGGGEADYRGCARQLNRLVRALCDRLEAEGRANRRASTEPRAS